MIDKIQALRDLFGSACDEAKRSTLQALPHPPVRYIIAFTPRAGSSYLCDVLKNMGRFGSPGEWMSADFVPKIRQARVPSISADDYLDLALKTFRSGNGVSGFKASWFQFQDFAQAMQAPQALAQCRFIHLTRRDLAAQAVSLYRAVHTGVFHTNIEHAPEKIAALARLPYDFAAIDEWRRHIEVQEQGWREYFSQHSIFPLSLSYEDVQADIRALVRRIACYLGRPRAAEAEFAPSIFQKISQRQSVEWACRYRLEQDAQERALRQCASVPDVGSRPT
jgi:LPS sulfotransferase NodH